MTWFSVSTLIAFRVPTGDQTSIGVNEDLYLIEAETVEEAQEIATKEAMIYVNLDDDLRLNDKPVIREFLGIRKVMKILNIYPLTSNDPPASGAEISHSYYEVKGVEELELLRADKPTWVHYVDESETPGDG